MAGISENEKLRRQRMVRSVIATHAMEGIQPDEMTLTLYRRYESGELTLEGFSAEMDAHVLELVAAGRPLAGVA